MKNTLWHGNIDSNLADYWSEFVDCKKRLKKETPFLNHILKKFSNPSVLDAALGIGCETIWLTKKGINVIGNEICRDFSEIAIKTAAEEGVSISVTAVDWRELVNYFGSQRFDITFLLGNSLCLLKSYKERIQVAESLYQICKKNGQLIIDERNFRYIWRSRKSILKGNFRYSGEVMYCGKNIIGRPIKINSDCVTFGYFEEKSNTIIGTLDMHPFKGGEMIELFKKVGFRIVDVYSDLVPGFNRNADFYTYVFSR